MVKIKNIYLEDGTYYTSTDCTKGAVIRFDIRKTRPHGEWINLMYNPNKLFVETDNGDKWNVKWLVKNATGWKRITPKRVEILKKVLLPLSWEYDNKGYLKGLYDVLWEQIGQPEEEKEARREERRAAKRQKEHEAYLAQKERELQNSLQALKAEFDSRRIA